MPTETQCTKAIPFSSLVVMDWLKLPTYLSLPLSFIGMFISKTFLYFHFNSSVLMDVFSQK
jgi:hypothetical protein